MKKKKYALVAIYFLLTVVLTAVSPVINSRYAKSFSGLPEKLIPAKEDPFSREYLTNIKNNDFEKIKASTYSKVELTPEVLDQMSNELSNVKVEEAKVVGAKFSTKNGVKTQTLAYEFKVNDDSYKVIGIVTLENQDGIKLAGIRLVNATTSMAQAELSFDFKKQGLNYILLVLLSLFVSVTAYMYVKKSPKPRWWVLLVIMLIALSIKILPGGDTEVNLGPIVQSGFRDHGAVLELLVPVGAVYYWIRRKKIWAKEQNMK